MVKEISRNIIELHKLELLRLSDFNVLPCTGCYTCLIKKNGCVLKDDYNRISEMIVESDALIVTASTYFLGANSCPLCGGETFLFFGDDRVQCMLCSNIGTIDMNDGVPVFDIQRGEHEFFLTLQDVIEHREWPMGMKSRFLKHKSGLKQISLDYRKDGEWVKP